jgi:hypothetical protein
MKRKKLIKQSLLEKKVGMNVMQRLRASIQNMYRMRSQNGFDVQIFENMVTGDNSDILVDSDTCKQQCLPSSNL